MRPVHKNKNYKSAEIIGGKELAGKIKISGYKHALTVIISATIISNSKKTILYNVPDTYETKILIKILEKLGADVEFSKNTLRLGVRNMRNKPIPIELSKKIHGSIYFIPAMLARFGEISFGEAGGDRIAGASGKDPRSIEHIISILKKFGAEFKITKKGVVGKCKKFLPQTISISEYSEHEGTNSGPFVSGATKTAILAASAVEGETIIKNPWDKDAAVELLSFIRACGCQIRFERGNWIIKGGMSRDKVRYRLASDPTEIITYISCSTFLRNPITLTNITKERIKKFLRPEFKVLGNMGIRLKWTKKELKIIPPKIIRPLKVVATSRGLNTDSQPFFTLMLTTASGPSSVSDYVWKSRFAYVKHLGQLGARLKNRGRTVIINPKKPFIQKTVIDASDTRSAAVAVLGALGVKGPTKVNGIAHIDRGYENFFKKLEGIGARVYRYR